MDDAAAVRALFLIAARAPVAGETKTRLGAAIGMERAAVIYRAFLRDLAARFTPELLAASGCDLGWAFSPGKCDFAAHLRGIGHRPAPTVRFVPQVGDGWGERQANLLRWGIEHGYERTVLVASDSPQLLSSVAKDAVTGLDDHDLVYGRVLDGGYYLVGIKGEHDVLSGVPMSTASAADALVGRAEALGLRIAELPPTFDVDEAADLTNLRAALAADPWLAPATWAALGALGLIGERQEGAPKDQAATQVAN